MIGRLVDSVRPGALDLASRVVMAPMTPDRAGPEDVPTPLMAEYWRQRAGAGLIFLSREPNHRPLARARAGCDLSESIGMPKADFSDSSCVLRLETSTAWHYRILWILESA